LSAYLIFIREGEILDPAAMAEYQSPVRPQPAPGGMVPLVVYGKSETFEGEGADGVVILQFPDKEAAKAWYFSPEYQAKAVFRKQAAPYRCMLIDGFEMPGSKA